MEEDMRSGGFMREGGAVDVLEIAVCEDIMAESRVIVEYAELFFRKRRRETRVDAYGDMDSLLASGKEYGLYLLDVMLPGTSGIQGAEILRQRSGDPVIVFITSSLESAVDGYRVNAAGFLLKPVTRELFDETMQRVTEQRLNLEKAVLSVVCNRTPVELALDQLVFFESRLHRVYANLAGGEIISIGQKLSWVQEKLEYCRGFLRCHQSYLVNLDYVRNLEDSCFVMDNGRMVPVSRNFYKESKQAYYRYRLR